MKNKISFLSAITLLMLIACDASISINNRSGSLNDDYIAEPLSDRSKKYESALETSNEIIKKISQKEYDFIYHNMFDEILKSKMSKDEFTKQMNQIDSGVGPVKTFKELQWSFFSGQEQDMDLLYSIKIVEHENQFMKYLFVFRQDSEYKHIVGYHAKNRDGVSPPGKF